MRIARPRLLMRSTAASLIAGIGLLNAAEAQWAHAVGVVCLFAFIVLGFWLIVVETVAAPSPTER